MTKELTRAEQARANRHWLWDLQPWWFKRLSLFTAIVWRMYEGGRMTVECSWAVARAMHPGGRHA